VIQGFIQIPMLSKIGSAKKRKVGGSLRARSEQVVDAKKAGAFYPRISPVSTSFYMNF